MDKDVIEILTAMVDEAAGQLAAQGVFTGEVALMFSKCKTQLAERESAAPPAIPEEVRETLSIALREYEPPSDMLDDLGACNELCDRIEAARAWLASAPVASHKAMCPKCGGYDTWWCIPNSDPHGYCRQCKMDFPVQVLVISPPREPKETL